MSNTKKIFITVSEGSIARNILRSFVLSHLMLDPGLSIYLLIRPEKLALYKREFSSDRVSVIPIEYRRKSFFDNLVSFLARNGIYTGTVLADQKTFSRNLMIFFIKRVLVYLGGRSLQYHRLIRWLAGLRRTPQAIEDVFERYQPDLLFATDVMNDLDLDLMLAAKRRKVKVVGMSRSWDNPTAGGLVQIIPETLVVWSPYLYRKMSTLQHIPQEQIKIVGIPHYDWYTKKDILLTREKFLEKSRLSPFKKVILFAGIGTFLAPHEAEVVQLLSQAISEGKIREDVQVIFRPHPSFATEREKINALAHVVFDDGVADYTSSALSSAEMDRGKILHLVNSLYHADLVITTASTMTIDAVFFDKPVICIAFDGKSKEPYSHSVRRYYHDYTHYRDLSRTGGFKIAYTPLELIRHINDYLQNPKLDGEGREMIRKEFIWKLDGCSAKRLAETIFQSVSL